MQSGPGEDDAEQTPHLPLPDEAAVPPVEAQPPAPDVIDSSDLPEPPAAHLPLPVLAGPALPPLVRAVPDAPTSVPATSPFGITVPVPIVSDAELGLARAGAHSAAAPRVGAMLSGAIPAVPPPPAPVTTPLRAVLLWSGMALLLVAALLAAIGGLNQTFYSASGFVQLYLSALEKGDAPVALSFPGVRLDAEEQAAAGLPVGAADTLLRSSVLRGPEDTRFVSDTNDGDGHHVVTYSVKLGGEWSDVVFDVERDGSWAGVFHNWRFATSPLAAVNVTVLHDTSFTVNDLTLDARAHQPADAVPTFDNAASYLVLSPGLYTFSREARLLEAPAVDVVVLQQGTQDVSLDVQPTPAFVSEVQTEIDGFLDECAAQKVLLPTGCPFGTVIDDRVIGEPTWSIVAYPVVTLVPGENAWDMPETGGTAHIVVQVQSLFDGTESTIDRDEPYVMGATVVIGADGTLNIELH